MKEGKHSNKRIARKDGYGDWVLGRVLGEGGEGEVYEVVNSPSSAVKVYATEKRPTGAKREKLIAMEKLRPSCDGERPGHPPLAWPEQVIRDRSTDSLIGFVMPRVDNFRTMSIGEFYDPAVRKDKLRRMKISLRPAQVEESKLKIIANLASTVARVHERGHLIGDINERNVLVDPEHGDVSIIDCDSFEIRDPENRRIYRCRVGRPEYTAPELLRQMHGACTTPSCPVGPTGHQKGFACVDRTEEHDNFAVAVLVFRLLMDGGHPFDCRIEEGCGLEADSRSKKIERELFPYSASKPSYIHVNNRENMKRYSKISGRWKKLFERTFGPR